MHSTTARSKTPARPKTLDAPNPRQAAPEGVTLNEIVAHAAPRDTQAQTALGHGEANISGVRIGRVAGLSEAGLPLVDFPDNPVRVDVAAQSTVRVTPADVGRGAVLVFEDGSPSRPVVLGLLETAPTAPSPGDGIREPVVALAGEALRVEADDRRVVVTADEELVLRCGKASITLTRAGKLILRGAYLLSRSSGVNRIKGGSVQIN